MSVVSRNRDRGLIVDDESRGVFKVNRQTMTSQELFVEEQKNIFSRCWLYVGHESEIPGPGDFQRRTVAGRPLMLVRGSSGEVNVFYNTCTHRGALVCRTDSGTSRNFQCFYHAWTFSNDGELVGIPDVQAYGDGLDRAELALKRPPCVESYRGFVFVAFTDSVPPLADYLGEIKEYMDIPIDAGEVVGGWEVAPGEVAYKIKANWKLMIENSIDNYHFDTVHQTYNAYMAERKTKAAEGSPEAPGRMRDRGKTSGFTVPGGHGGFTFDKAHNGRPLASWIPMFGADVRDEIEATRGALEDRYGTARMRKMADGSRSLLIFPNLMFQDSATGFRLRAIWPVTPGTADVHQWELVPRGESLALRRIRMDGARAFLGPGGFATPDDIEAVESCQAGFSATEVEYSDISRGMQDSEPRDDHELQMRGFWRSWNNLMDSPQGGNH
jgi:p-cumate 2,3-dioxygenase alpha subunit